MCFIYILSRDSWGRRNSRVVAMDAILFKNPAEQFTLDSITREINKAYIGFQPMDENERAKILPIVTGHWGCGAFNGDKQLKGFIR